MKTATTQEANEMLSDITRSHLVDTYQAETVLVSYEDMANPLRVGTIVEHIAGEFRIAWDDEDGGETWSDLRQAGWNLALSRAW